MRILSSVSVYRRGATTARSVLSDRRLKRGRRIIETVLRPHGDQGMPRQRDVLSILATTSSFECGENCALSDGTQGGGHDAVPKIGVGHAARLRHVERRHVGRSVSDTDLGLPRSSRRRVMDAATKKNAASVALQRAEILYIEWYSHEPPPKRVGKHVVTPWAGRRSTARSEVSTTGIASSGV